MPNVGAEFTASIVIDKNDLITEALKQLSTVQKELENNKLEIYFDFSNQDLQKKLKEYQKQLSSTDYTIKISNDGIEETYKSLDKLLDVVKSMASGKAFGTGSGNGKGIGNSIIDENQLNKAIALFEKIETHLSSMKKVIADVGDGSEFSPLLTTINKIDQSINKLSSSFSRTGFNMNIDLGSDNELKSKIESKTAGVLHAYEKLFNQIKTSGSLSQAEQGIVDNLNISNFDGMEAKISEYERVIKELRAAQKSAYGKDYLRSDIDNQYWTAVSGAKQSLSLAKKSGSKENVLKDMFGGTDLSEVISQLTTIASKLDSIVSVSQDLKSSFTQGLNVSTSVEEITKLTDRVKELEDELAKVKLPTVTAPQESNISSGLDSSISKYQEIVSLVKEYYELSQKLESPKLSYQKRSEDYDKIDAYLLSKKSSHNIVAGQNKSKEDREKNINDTYHDMSKGINEGKDFAIKAMKSAIQSYWSNVTEMPSNDKLLSSRKIDRSYKGSSKEEYIIPKKYQDMEKSVIQETIAMNKNNIAYEEERKQIEANNSALKERMNLIRNTIKGYDKNPDYNGEYKMGLSLKSGDKNKTDIFSSTSSMSQEEMLQEICNMLGVEIPKNADKAKEAIKEVASATASTDQKKDAFPSTEAKLDEAVTSAKDLDKTLEQVDMPTDSFDKVLEKLDRTKSELVDIVKITRKSVSDKDGKFHDSYTLKDSRGSTEIYGMSSKTDKGQILDQNIVKYDAKKDSIDKSKEELEVQKQITAEIKAQSKAHQKKWQDFQKEDQVYQKKQSKDESIKRNQIVYKELTDTIKQYSEVAKRVSNGKAEDGDLEKMVQLEEKISQLQKHPILSESQVAKSENSLVSLYDQLDKIERKIQEVNQKKVDTGFDKLLTYQGKADKYNATIKRFQDGGWTSDTYSKNVKAVRDAVEQYENLLNDIKAKGGIASEEDIHNLKEYEGAIKKAVSAVENMSASEKGYSKLQGQKEIDKINQILKENSAMSQEAKNKIKAFKQELMSGNPSMSLEKIHGEIMAIVNAEEQAGRAGKSMWSKITDKVVFGYAAQLANYFLSFSDFIRYGQQMVSTVIDLNTQITELAKVSEQSSSQIYDDFGSYAKIAEDVRGTISDTISATADWSKNGYNIPDAQQLAEVSQLYKNVGDGINIDEANESLISTLKGFKLEADQAEHIVDVFNEVSNNEAISSGGIGDALQRSAASFNAANTSLEKSVALVTATNSVLQDPEKVGCTYIADLYSNVMKIKVAISVNIQKWTRPSKDLYVVM